MLCFRRQKAVTVDPMVFACVAMMSRAIGPKISKEVKDLLEPMLSVGLRYSSKYTNPLYCHNDCNSCLRLIKSSSFDSLLQLLTEATLSSLSSLSDHGHPLQVHVSSP